MRERCRHSLVIWYDAVTIEGSLSWQDTLNNLNQPFYDACDAIFVNYSWKVEVFICNIELSLSFSNLIFHQSSTLATMP